MAKMFYTMDEARQALGKNEEEIKQLTREGRLREFRDGPRLMFKADQVEQLKSEIGGGGGGGGANLDQIDLGPSDSGAPIGLAGSSLSGSGSGSLGASGTGTGAGITLSDDTMPSGGAKGDSALAADLGLSGSLGGVPSPGARGSGGSGSGSGLSGSRAGVSVFTADEVEGVDPSAQTAISAGVTDQVNLEGVGSGSGLLDLTRESDDTSLGAELLDEIQPGAGGGQRRAVQSDTAVAPAIEMEEPRGGVTRPASVPQYVEAFDSSSGAFGGAALGAALFLLFGLFVITAAVAGAFPPIVKSIGGYNLAAIAGMGAGLAIVFCIVGLVVGKKR